MTDNTVYWHYRGQPYESIPLCTKALIESSAICKVKNDAVPVRVALEHGTTATVTRQGQIFDFSEYVADSGNRHVARMVALAAPDSDGAETTPSRLQVRRERMLGLGGVRQWLKETFGNNVREVHDSQCRSAAPTAATLNVYVKPGYNGVPGATENYLAKDTQDHFIHDEDGVVTLSRNSYVHIAVHALSRLGVTVTDSNREIVVPKFDRKAVERIAGALM